MEIRELEATDRDAVERFVARVSEGGDVIGYLAAVPLHGWASHVGEL